VQLAWIPFWAAGVINGLGHYFGYRNFATDDDSTNMVPWAAWIGGEELHNNHHAYPTSAKFSIRPYEFDLGWMYITIMSALGLATVRKRAPKVVLDPTKFEVDAQTLQAVIAHRYDVLGEVRQVDEGHDQRRDRLDAQPRPRATRSRRAGDPQVAAPRREGAAGRAPRAGATGASEHSPRLKTSVVDAPGAHPPVGALDAQHRADGEPAEGLVRSARRRAASSR
jgi:stearoyl-CoA desaturase (delta-9 desaturase)